MQVIYVLIDNLCFETYIFVMTNGKILSNFFCHDRQVFLKLFSSWQKKKSNTFYHDGQRIFNPLILNLLRQTGSWSLGHWGYWMSPPINIFTSFPHPRPGGFRKPVYWGKKTKLMIETTIPLSTFQNFVYYKFDLFHVTIWIMTYHKWTGFTLKSFSKSNIR